jgi:hypothetical protein
MRCDDGRRGVTGGASDPPRQEHHPWARSQLKAAPILLDGPSLVVEGERVTHLRYTIRRP